MKKEESKEIRLDKFLANMEVGTRSQVKGYLKKGLVSVNGDTKLRPEAKIDPLCDVICYQGRELVYEKNVYYMLHKPAGYLSAVQDRFEPTVLELMDNKKGIAPVGRLDKDTEGLLLLTDDGVFAHNLLSPKKHVEKTYYAEMTGVLKPEYVELFREGMDIGEKHSTLPAELKIIESGEVSRAELTIYEGKYHQVKRMFAKVGNEVTYLKRISMGGVELDPNLEKGDYRPLTEQELNILNG